MNVSSYSVQSVTSVGIGTHVLMEELNKLLPLYPLCSATKEPDSSPEHELKALPSTGTYVYTYSRFRLLGDLRGC